MASTYFAHLPQDTQQDSTAALEALRTRFSNAPLQFLLRQELNNRRQAPTESLEDYCKDILQKCHRLGIKGNEVRDIFIQGLNPDVKSHVILNSPKSTEEAVTLARLKTAVNQETSDYHFTKVQKLMEEIKNSLKPKDEIKELRDQLLQLGTSPQSNTTTPSSEIQQLRDEIQKLKSSKATSRFAAYDNEQVPVRSPNDQYLTGPSEVYRLRNDLRKLQTQLDRMQSTQNRFGTGRSYNPTGRNQRTTSGDVICNNCQRVGHIARNCRGLLRDPRIPQQSRFRSTIPFTGKPATRPQFTQNFVRPRQEN